MGSRPVDFEYRDRLVEIGLTIAALRKLNGYSQEALADKAGVSRQTIALIESPNSVQAFSVETLLKIADALNVKAGDILNNTFPSGK